MVEIIFNKLVRDGIPDKVLNNGETPIYRTLNDDEYKIELLKKLIEEARELLETPNIEERADIAEILKSIDGIYAFSQSDIESVRIEKLHKRGGFSKKIFLEKTTD